MLTTKSNVLHALLFQLYLQVNASKEVVLTAASLATVILPIKLFAINSKQTFIFCKAMSLKILSTFPNARVQSAKINL